MEYEKLSVKLTDSSDFGGGRFVVVGSWRATPRGHTTTFGTPMAAVLDVAGGKVVRVRAFFDEQLALDDARGATGQ
jgi:ketosteroid isomerase-like protein